MKPVCSAVERRRARRVFVATLMIALFAVTGCGESGDDDDDQEEPSNSWDEMRWDESSWGAVEARPGSVLIS